MVGRQPGSNNSRNPIHFSDTNAIREPLPAAVMPMPRRSRGQSISTSTTARQPSTLYHDRDSLASDNSLATTTTTTIITKRNRFRSDPFDLERPELLAGAATTTTTTNNNTTTTNNNSNNNNTLAIAIGGSGSTIRRPCLARRPRAESYSSSKYSSGVISIGIGIGMGDWSDPGPDVGPAAARRGGQAAPAQDGWRERLLERRLSGRGPGRGRGRGRGRDQSRSQGQGQGQGGGGGVGVEVGRAM
ncbi:hypothetical protein VTK56DRAFT_5601 [Thermocarpiscus australiensis]